MTPQERAEKIKELLNDPWGDPIANDVVEALVQWVNTQISEAEREAYLKGFHEGQKGLYAKGFRAAREKAKRIAEF